MDVVVLAQQYASPHVCVEPILGRILRGSRCADSMATSGTDQPTTSDWYVLWQHVSDHECTVPAAWLFPCLDAADRAALAFSVIKTVHNRREHSAVQRTICDGLRYLECCQLTELGLRLRSYIST